MAALTQKSECVESVTISLLGGSWGLLLFDAHRTLNFRCGLVSHGY